jgi:hypothetical protein
LPFILQKSGLIPTVMMLLFTCCLSTFSSICFLESGRLINRIKLSRFEQLDFAYLTETLLKDKIFSSASKYCIQFNHLLYSILSIITLTKIIPIFIIQEIPALQGVLDLINKDKVQFEKNIKFENSFQKFNSEILNNGNMIIMLIVFTLFLFYSLLNKYLKRFLNSLIFFITVFVCVHIFTLFAYFDKVSNRKLVAIPLVGNDYTYVRS